jgi:Na+-transporting NADH:ubiquinone oxidoreductase subunit A
MSKTIKIRKGLDIKLVGQAEKVLNEKPSSSFALKPTDFHGLVPKLLVKEGDRVNAGSPVFYDKNNEKVLFTSPVCGTVTEIVRGNKRVLLEIRIARDESGEAVKFGKADPKDLDWEQVTDKMMKSGVWPALRQRPFSIIANPKDNPKAIFISGFDTAPLAPDTLFTLQGSEEEFHTGIEALRKLTDGRIYLNLRSDMREVKVFSDFRGVDVNYFSGPHPSGNVGVQIHHLAPLNKGEVVWYVHPQDVLTIGRLFVKGVYDPHRIIALTGSGILHPGYFKVLKGTSIHGMVADNVKKGELRFISGNVLTGTQIERNGYLGFYDTQVTVIPEGRSSEFLGWAMPRFNKLSLSRSYFSWLIPGKRYTLDTNLNGAIRAIVMTGEFEKVFPFSIYPVHLIKAILVKDIDKMEALGIYEVDEEDFALCEFIDTSKMEIQAIIREGLDYIRHEMS